MDTEMLNKNAQIHYPLLGIGLDDFNNLKNLS